MNLLVHGLCEVQAFHMIVNMQLGMLAFPNELPMLEFHICSQFYPTKYTLSGTAGIAHVATNLPTHMDDPDRRLALSFSLTHLQQLCEPSERRVPVSLFPSVLTASPTM